MATDGTTASDNQAREATALALLKAFISRALSLGGKATHVVVEVPLHGTKLGEPMGYVKQKA